MELNRRQTHRVAIIKLAAFVRGDDFERATLIELKERLASLQASYDRFVEEHQNIVANADANDLDTQNQLFAEVSEQRTGIAVRIQTRIQEIKNNEQAEIERRQEEVREENRQRELNERLELQRRQQEENENRQRELQEAQRCELIERNRNTVRNNNENRGNDDEAQQPEQLKLNANDEAVGSVAQQQPFPQQVPNRQVPAQANLIQMQYQMAAAAGMRLERITTPIFSGEYSQWNEWKAMYDSLVHFNNALSNTQKFHYLKKSVSGQAERMLSGWHAIGENYQQAYETLLEVFDNGYRIISAHLDELHAMPRMTLESYEGLRQMIDTVNRFRQSVNVIVAMV